MSRQTPHDFEIQLNALGFGERDTLYLRAISLEGAAENITQKLPRAIARATELNKQEYGIYLVVNGGGHRDRDVKAGRALWYEHDDGRDKATLANLWQHLGLPEPSLQIDTGGKSIHSYWIFAEHVPIENWLPLQADFVAPSFSGGDPKVKNPSRVMRLAGFRHLKSRQVARVIHTSPRRYTYEELRGLVPSQPAQDLSLSLTEPELAALAEKRRQRQRPSPSPATAIPLELLLAKTHRDLITGGARQGSRNNSGAALARDLIGADEQAAALGIPIQGDREQLFFAFCQASDPGDGWGEREWQAIWRSAELSVPAACLSPHIMEECYRAFQSREAAPRQPASGTAPQPQASEADPPAAITADCRLKQLYLQTETILGGRLRYNLLSKELEVDGKSMLSLKELQICLALEANFEIPDNHADKILPAIAKAHQYNPVVEYLDDLEDSDPAFLDGLADRYLGTSDQLHAAYLRKTLIAAVARAYEPGCKHDTALILQGKQGYQKSSFYKILASPQWFNDSLSKVSNKDELLKLHKVWITEWPELEEVFKRRSTASVKAFLSCSDDLVRPPWEAATQRFKRAGIIVGTTNENEFLLDNSGSRRFWVIPVSRRIDTALLAKERDRIWAAARAAYKAGCAWWLELREEELSEKANEEYEAVDPWIEPVMNYLEGKSQCTTAEILTEAIGMALDRQGKADQMRAASLLRAVGWSKGRQPETIGGRRVRIWRPTSPQVKPQIAAPKNSTKDRAPADLAATEHRADLNPPPGTLVARDLRAGQRVRWRMARGQGPTVRVLRRGEESGKIIVEGIDGGTKREFEAPLENLEPIA